jgi:hypothetical protein
MTSFELMVILMLAAGGLSLRSLKKIILLMFIQHFFRIR